MSTEQEIEHHRSFLWLWRSMEIYNEDARYQSTNGPPNRAQRMERDAVYKNHVNHSPRWPGPLPRSRTALLYQGGHLQAVQVVEKRNQRFHEFATPWEHSWSSFLFGFRRFTPIVDENLAVIGHYGGAGRYNYGIADLIVPRDAFPSETVKSYPVSLHRVKETDELKVIPASGEFVSLDWNELRDALERGINIFVYPHNVQPPSGWVRVDLDTPQNSADVITSVDGAVQRFLFEYSGGETSVDFSPLDLLSVAKLLVNLGAKVGSRLTRVLMRRRVPNTSPRNVLDGPTERLGKQVVKPASTGLFKGLQLGRGYDPRMGIPEEHLKAMIDAAKETQVIAMFRANKSVAIPLIRRGAHGKPMWAKFKTSSETGVLTTTNVGEVATANMHGYFVVDVDGIAKRMVTRGSQTVKEELKLVNPFWTVKPGQVIAKDGKPVVGDYDLLGVAPIKSPGRNISVVPDNIAYGDWRGPDVTRYMSSVNKPGRLDEPRVLHGAQDQYGGNAKYMGLTDDTAYAVFPDGRTFVMEGRQAQQAFYDAMGRSAKSPGAPAGKPNWHRDGNRVIQGGKK